MKLCKCSMVFFFVFLLGGCAAVYVPAPVGENVVDLDDSWTGAWLHDDVVIQTQVADKETGLLNVAWIENEGPRLTLKSHLVYIRQQDGQIFASTMGDEVDQGYVWMVINRPSKDVTVIWVAKADRFRALISDGKLEGEILDPDNEHNDNVAVKALSPELLQQIVEPSSDLLQWENPFVLNRIAD